MQKNNQEKSNKIDMIKKPLNIIQTGSMTFFHQNHDAVSPDAYLCSYLKEVSPQTYEAELEIQNIPDHFLGFSIPSECLRLNIKSSIAQLGVDARMLSCELSSSRKRARLHVQFISCDPVAQALLQQIQPGCFLAKLFAADDRRLVRSVDYLERMLKHTDRNGIPLLRFGKHLEHLITFDVVDDRLVVSIPALPGIVEYNQDVYGFLPLVSKSLQTQHIRIRHLLSLYQYHADKEHVPTPGHILLIKTEPLHIRTVFARVVDELLPKNLVHTAANILEPTTLESGDIYEFHGPATTPVNQIPLELFTIEPYREHSFFCYRDLLQASLESDETIFRIFSTAPQTDTKTTTFLSKGSEIALLSNDSWVVGAPESILASTDQLDAYVEAQPEYPLLTSMETGVITSEGTLFSRYFPTTKLKSLLLSPDVHHYLKQLYFQIPSHSQGQYFSKADRSLLTDLDDLGIAIFWADKESQRVLQYAKRRGKQSGMFVPKDRIHEFSSAYFVGIHGSCLSAEQHKEEIQKLLAGLKDLTDQAIIPGFSQPAPLAVMTGGGRGAMNVGNKAAQELGILSCGNLVDFEFPHSAYLDAKMTYQKDSLIERQEHFYVDLAIFVPGGIGTDFELALEIMSLKTGFKAPVPVFLLGSMSYWERKLSTVYETNKRAGTIQGSEWISNCLFYLSSAEQGVEVFRQYIEGTLPIGPNHPSKEQGFVRA